MKRPIKTFVAVIAVAAIALTVTLAFAASAGAKTGAVQWVCDPGSGPVTFVSAPAKAFHGIDTADKHAGNIAFEGVLGEEDCHVVGP
jgi:hypothetical protein